MLRCSFVGAALLASLVLFSSAPARAAEIAWRGPAECQNAEVATAQVEKLVGRRLSAIDWITFEVEISVEPSGTHQLLLRTLARGSAPRERAIAGASCVEVTDAASVAIALSISEEERAQRERTPQAQATPEPVAASAAPPVEEEQAPSPGPVFALGLGLLIESGALPSAVPGLELAGALELRALRIAAFAAVFVPQDAELAGDSRGGTFDFVLAGIDLCGHPAFGDIHLLACAGFELGRIGARGKGVLNERDGDAGWYAPRAELGVGYGLAQVARVWLRGGIAMPLSRPEFVLDDTDRVHQPSGASLRGLLAVEVLL